MSRLEIINKTFKSVLQKIRAFLHHQQWKEALVFSCFVLLAFGFWLLQSLQQEYEIGIKIPVRYKNVPSDIAFTNDAPTEVIAKVKDRGCVLLNYSFGRTFAPIEVQLADTNKRQGEIFITQKEIENGVLKQLITSTSLIGCAPATIELTYSKRQQKSVPVMFDGEIHTKPGFQLSGEIEITPPTVNIYATHEVLDSINIVKTVPTEIKEGNKNVTRKLQLEKIDGVNIDPKQVSVTIPIEEYTEKTLDIPIHCIDLPDNYTIRMFPPTVKVTCSVPLSRFKELSADQFAIRINYSELEQNLNGTLPISLDEKPAWVHMATLFPEKVEFIIEENIR